MSAPTPEQIDRLLQTYPAVAALPAPLREQVLGSEAQVFQVPLATLLFEEQQPCQGFPMLLSGEVRVARGAPNGRSLELYRVVPGELCVASTSCLFGQAALSAHGQSTQACEIVMLSPQGFAAWTAEPGFRRYVFGLFADRLAELMALAEAVAFQRLDQRLAAALLGHGQTLQTTHQALADELGTVREIVTRLLKRFEREGWLRLGRERIDVLDPAALRALASPTVA
ncbi:Crp/Fnr family transcriptional regulator [Paucibacter sp. APW11]|uniref:Crp/Fnr family transcriptional regulator n=1 Tax=Roseateles aquae TaxID=3077235 RepID=A0ABU3PCY4_9BURK|nr:Crp/Fnr family transcriptional regulator [Paucibacter sp. APW11]MDT9000170.1 Crp/Fnr family transcriptional regulator [Paucibacter sp. APW11]